MRTSLLFSGCPAVSQSLLPCMQWNRDSSAVRSILLVQVLHAATWQDCLPSLDKLSLLAVPAAFISAQKQASADAPSSLQWRRKRHAVSSGPSSRPRIWHAVRIATKRGCRHWCEGPEKKQEPSKKKRKKGPRNMLSHHSETAADFPFKAAIRSFVWCWQDTASWNEFQFGITRFLLMSPPATRIAS